MRIILLWMQICIFISLTRSVLRLNRRNLFNSWTNYSQIFAMPFTSVRLCPLQSSSPSHHAFTFSTSELSLFLSLSLMAFKCHLQIQTSGFIPFSWGNIIPSYLAEIRFILKSSVVRSFRLVFFYNFWTLATNIKNVSRWNVFCYFVSKPQIH